MAPNTSKHNDRNSNGTALPPLADYFWVAGIDSKSYSEQVGKEVLARKSRSLNEGLDAEEVKEQEEEDDYLDVPSRSNSGANTPKRGSKTLNVPIPDARLSVGTIGSQGSGQGSLTGIMFSGGNGSSGTLLEAESNRNSASTITQSMLSALEMPNGLLDFDFDKALRKFAAERESFLDELSFSAGVVQDKPIVPPKARIILPDDSEKHSSTTSLLSKTGSIRRRISLRDLSSLRRAPSSVHRSPSIKSTRSTRRLSNYNSVIPTPQPLNPSPDMHPLKRKFEPVLLDRYPSSTIDSEEQERRMKFPDYVPMFAFPNDVNIVSADERPRSTWHSFTMTGGDGSHTYGVCVIIWLPLNEKDSEDLERRCEAWRKDNMSPEERELAASLGERLAGERAKLSRLLAKLPTVSANDREALDDEIISTEERISLMTDMLRPVRHGAASKIEGLTDGETGFWIPRAYGILGKEPSFCAFYKEWLKAVVVPMTNGQILRVAPSSPRVGIWKPLERYVMNLTVEAVAPQNELIQIELAVRDLKLYARKDAPNEIPGTRTMDLYGLFRALTLENIITAVEYALMEQRIILLSSHTAMLHIAGQALISLLYPFTWHHVYIPVLPARLLETLEAPFPYIVGIERRYDKINLPEDDFVLVDLDSNTIMSNVEPINLPRTQRRKLISLLQVAAGHHSRFGVPVGPPQYAIETYPHNAFMSENPSVFYQSVMPGSLGKLVNLPSASFGSNAQDYSPKPAIFNAFATPKTPTSKQSIDRPGTSGTVRGQSPPSPKSPIGSMYPPSIRSTATRNDSGFALSATLRGKRSGTNLDARRSSSGLALDRNPGALRRPSLPFAPHHSPSNSTSSLYSVTDGNSIYNSSMGSHYAPSTYSPSTIAASTIMPSFFAQPIRNTDNQKWVEGHCLMWKSNSLAPICRICEEPSDDGMYSCQNCDVVCHARCSQQIMLPCPDAFFPEQIRAAFVRCFASLFYQYRKFLQPQGAKEKKEGRLYKFNMDNFMKSLPLEVAEYMAKLEQTQGFAQFIEIRETKKANDPQVLLFDQVILAKRNRGKSSLFSKSSTAFLYENSSSRYRNVVATKTDGLVPGENSVPTNRIPARLDPAFFRAPTKAPSASVAVDTSRAKSKTYPAPPKLTVNGISNGDFH